MPHPHHHNLNVRVGPKLFKALNTRAEVSNLTRRALVVQLLEDGLALEVEQEKRGFCDCANMDTMCIPCTIWAANQS